MKVTQKSESYQWVVNGGKEGEIESGRSAELENCGQAEVEDHLRVRMWNLLVMVMRMIMWMALYQFIIVSESIMTFSRWDTWASASATTRNNTSQGGCQLSADSCDASTAPIWCYWFWYWLIYTFVSATSSWSCDHKMIALDPFWLTKDLFMDESIMIIWQSIWSKLASWTYSGITLDMSHSQMLGKFEYTLPAKFWRLVGCTEMLSW